LLVHYTGPPQEKRLHEAIGYVTPNDEHEGRGERIRQARVEGLARAAEARKDHRRRTKNDRPGSPHHDMD
jgi:putative transposase